MASTYSPLKLQLMATGENLNTWGTVTNVNLGTALEEAICGSADVTFASANVTLTLTNTNSTQTARNLRLNLVGTTGGARNLVVPAIEKLYIINNTCADAVTVKNSTGTGIAVPAGKTMWVYNDATNVVDVTTAVSSLAITGNATIGGTATITGDTTVGGATVTAGNVGIKRTPDAFGSQWGALSIGQAGNIYAPTVASSLYLASNLYTDGTDTRYITTAPGCFMSMGGGVTAWDTAVSGTAGTVATLTERMRLDANGNLGIGMTPTYSLDVTKDQNSLSAIRLTNSSSGTAARAYFTVQNSSNLTAMGSYGSSFVGTGIEAANLGFLLSTTSLALYTTSTGDTFFGHSGTEKARMSALLNGSYVTGTTNMAVPIAAGMDNGGGQIYAHRGFYTGPHASLQWGPGTYLIGTNATSIILSVDGVNGVQLLPGNNSWSPGISTRESKKDIEKIPGDPLARIAKMSGYLYRYKAEADDAPLKAGLMWDEVTEAFPWGAVDIPAKEATGDTPAQERVQTIIPDYQIALLVDAVNALTNKLTAALDRIAVLEAR